MKSNNVKKQSQKVYLNNLSRKTFYEKPLIVVLEDEMSCANEMLLALKTKLNWECIYLPSFKEFVYASKELIIDAISIDWVFGTFHKGKEIFSQIKRDNQLCGSMVFTQHENIIGDANKVGADAVVHKIVQPDTKACTVNDDYIREMEIIFRLGVYRQIITYLGFEKIIKRDSFNSGKEDDTKILDRAKTTVLEARNNGQIDPTLECLLNKIGMFDLVDIDSLINKSFYEKVKFVFDELRLEEKDVSEIFNVEDNIAQALKTLKMDSININKSIFRPLDGILSIFSYLCKISNYKREFIHINWNSNNLYQNYSNKPPWDKEGLRKHLIKNGTTAIDTCVTWIRSL